MFPSTPPSIELSRSRLRQMGLRIRDELDPIIARDGPEQLRPDDVLTLHDFFLALRTSSKITALDLRATGIHKAVLDVSGIATRWPGRLADDCDKVISMWTAKFGRLEDLHPFLYGRGGRLEGIASIEESSKQALMKRWQHSCPDKIAPKRSRQHGSLGFRAGAWWIDPLFAWHAGIIDVDSVEGGVCYDKDAAYALLLKDTGEVDAPAESSFTYRCGRNDRGKFRLTAATPKCRLPIRVLRSHSVNSIWGPKAGVRYEGFTDVTEQANRIGEIVYDVTFARVDPVPMEEVIKIPTTFQVDEYSEYKRLRRLHHNLHQKVNTTHPDIRQTTVKIAPQIAPAPPQLSQLMSPQAGSPAESSPNTSRAPTFEHPIKSAKRISSTLRPTTQLPLHDMAEALSDKKDLFLFRSPQKSTFSEQEQTNTVSGSQHEKSDSIPNSIQHNLASEGSSNSYQSYIADIKEIAPWISHSLQLTSLLDSPPPVIRREAIGKARMAEEDYHVTLSNAQDSSPEAAYSGAKHGPSWGRKKSISEKRIHGALPAAQTEYAKKKESRKSIFARSRTAMAKLSDGVEDSVAGIDYFNCRMQWRSNSISPRNTAPQPPRRNRASSSGLYPRSSIPLHPLSPLSISSPLFLDRRDAFVFPYGVGLESNASAATLAQGGNISPATHNNVFYEDSFIEPSPTPPRQSVPISLRDCLSSPRRKSPVRSPVPSEYSLSFPNPELTRKGKSATGPNPRAETPEHVDKLRGGGESESGSSLAEERLGRFFEHHSDEVVVFKDPFAEL